MRGIVAVLTLSALVALLVPRAPTAVAQGGCGGLNLGIQFGGSFNLGGGFNIGLQFGGQAFNTFGLSNFGFQFGGRPGCGIGIFGLAPGNATVAPGGQITYQLIWISPNHWRDLEHLDLRLRDGNEVAVIRWFEATNQFAIVDPVSGQVHDRGTGGSQNVLRTPLADVLLRNTFVEDSGPNGQAVGLNVELTISPSLEGRQLSVDVGAKADDSAPGPYELASLLDVTSAAQADPNNDDEEDEARKPTEEQRQQRARTNTASLDDYRTEGNALASDCAAAIPTVTIANRDGSVVLHLLHDARDACRLVQPGDYVEAIGEKQHEQLYEVDQVTVRRNGTRVR